MKSYSYVLITLVCVLGMFVCGCNGGECLRDTDTADSTSETVYTESAPDEHMPSLVIDTMTVPLYSYETYEELGDADITLVYDSAICDYTAENISDSAYLESIMMIRNDTPTVDGQFTVDEDEIFNWFYSGYARVYGIENKIEYTEDDGYHYETLRYLHGMTGAALEAYGEEANERFLERREYMYLIRVADNTWLCMDFYVPENAPALDGESEYYDRVAARVEVPRLEYDISTYGEYLLGCIGSHLSDGKYCVRTPEMHLEYLPDTEQFSEYTDIMQLDTWKVMPSDTECAVKPDDFCMFFGSDYIADYNICATDAESVMAVTSPDAPTIYFSLPDEAAEEMTAIPRREAENRRAEYAERVDKMKSFLPDGAVRLADVSQIFCMSDFLLSYETDNGEVCIWRAEDLGLRYEKLEITIPEEYQYDRAEVIGISDGGGSGDFCVLINIYDGDDARILEFLGSGRGECIFSCELTEEELEARRW